MRLIFNSGAAFSVGSGSTWLFTIVAAVVVVVVLRMAPRLTSLAWAATMGLLLAGALGNLTDRLVRPPAFLRGHVVDFIDYNGWFIGNVADICIVVAAIVLLGLSLTGRGPSDPVLGSSDNPPSASNDAPADSVDPKDETSHHD